MAKVTIRRGDAEFEVSDLTLEEVKELIGVNGRTTHQPSSIAAVGPIAAPVRQPAKQPDFRGFLDAISDRGRVFVSELKHHPSGIDAYELAKRIGYADPRQIGGLTGGGLAKIATRYGIKLADVYRTEITFPEGKRTVTFYPGKLIVALIEQKPA